MKIHIKNNLYFSYQTPPIIIAEISGNHNGKLSVLKRAILNAKKNGADLVKIQTYEPQDIILKNKNSKSKIKKGIWKNQTLWNLYKKAQTPFRWHEELFKFAQKNKINLFSSPFSIRGVKLLSKLDVPLFKVASFEITDLNLIEEVAKTKKPIILSTGCCTNLELKMAINIIKKFHSKIIVMHCESGYPTKIENSKINKINYLKKKFKNTLVGLSDHTSNISSALAATSLGVCCIEKHYNFNETKTVDSPFSINQDSLKNLKRISKEIFLSLNNNINFDEEKKDSFYKRSIYALKDIKKGEKFTKINIGNFRPKEGICASQYKKILGKYCSKNISSYSPLKNLHVKNFKIKKK